jgi:hypothetical protein
MGSPDEAESITLQINQLMNAPGYACYSRTFALYHGDVCSYSFSFDRGNLSWDEDENCIMDPDALTATKTLYYEDWGEGRVPKYTTIFWREKRIQINAAYIWKLRAIH